VVLGITGAIVWLIWKKRQADTMNGGDWMNANENSQVGWEQNKDVSDNADTDYGTSTMVMSELGDDARRFGLASPGYSEMGGDNTYPEMMADVPVHEMDTAR
jgi:hypothetical protein